MEERQFDVVIFGTGLVESITAAALSKAGYKVAHIDSNPYYGGDEASLSLEELVQWADKAIHASDPTSRFQYLSRSTDLPSQSRQYSICLQPAVIPSTGPMISSLVMSGVAKYSGFRLLDCVSVYDSSGCVRNVPGSKEDIFKSKDIGLIEKRRLMRFLAFASSDFEGKKELEGKQDLSFLEFLRSVFSLTEEISSIIAYCLAFCMSPSEPTFPTLQRLRRYLRSAGRYGPSPFLIGHYGGIGDIAQGFCRAAAVSGAVYILSRNVSAVSRPQDPPATSNVEAASSSREDKPKYNYTIDLEDFPDTLECNLIISGSSYVPHALKNEVRQLPASSANEFKSNVTSIARCIAIIDQALALRTPEPQPQLTESSEQETDLPPFTVKDATVDTGILVFPPSSVRGGSTTHSATALINGEGSMSTPKGKWLVYIALPVATQAGASLSPEALLSPYLDALMLLSVNTTIAPIKPLFTTFYLDTPPVPLNVNSLPDDEKTYLVPFLAPLAPLPEFSDEVTVIAESTFMAAAKILRTLNNRLEGEDVLWPSLPVDDDDEESDW